MDQAKGEPSRFIKHIIYLQPGCFYDLLLWALGRLTGRGIAGESSVQLTFADAGGKPLG